MRTRTHDASSGDGAHLMMTVNVHVSTDTTVEVRTFADRKHSEFPSVDGRLDARRCWSTAVEAAGQATRADSLGGSVPAVSG